MSIWTATTGQNSVMSQNETVVCIAWH